MIPRPTIPTLTDPLLSDTTFFRSDSRVKFGGFRRLRTIGTAPATTSTNRRTALRCSENRKVETMKTKIAQAATFAFSAVGALAIFVGAVNYPATAANAAGAPAVGLVGAASTPAVSPMA